MKRVLALLTSALLLAPAGLLLAQDSGPKKDVGETVARPRKKGDAPPSSELPKIPSKLSKKNAPDTEEGAANFTVESSLVNVDVAVLDNKGRFIPNIPRGNFRILEDNVPQQVTNFAMGEAPMTVALVIEFSNLFQSYWSQGWYESLSAAYGFVETLKPEDYVAVIAYDMRPEILSDFTTDRRKTQEAMSRMRIAAYSESNLYDALTDTADRMSGIEGRKAIVLIASGIDTFSKLTFDKTRKSLQSSGVPIYAIGIMQAYRIINEAYMDSITRLDFLQADNQMRVFAKETGGQAYFPRFFGEFPGIFQSIQSSLRNQYSLGYSPSNAARDGKFRKIKVELVNPENNQPLRINDEKGKPIKYQIIAKSGYTAPREVE
jgi:VWFA-related protein